MSVPHFQAKKAARISVIGCEEELQDLKRQLEEESAHRKQVTTIFISICLLNL